MKPERFSLFEIFYRTKQTAVCGILLAGKMTDLISAFNRLCDKNGITIPDGMHGQMGEVESMLRRIEDINSLPLTELMRLPRLNLSPESKQGDEFDPDSREVPRTLERLSSLIREYGKVCVRAMNESHRAAREEVRTAASAYPSSRRA